MRISDSIRGLFLKSLLVALLIGPLVALVSTVTSVHATVEYEPGVSQVELKSYDSRTVSELEAFLKSRQLKLTRYQWLRESIGYSYFWKGIALSSVGPFVGIFLGSVVVGMWDRRYGSTGNSSGAFRRWLVGCLEKVGTRLSPGICVATAFLPLAVTAFGIYVDTVWGIHADDISTLWGMFLNPINLAAYFWLGITCVYYWRTRTRSAAWLFALFPIAFAEPALLLSLWISSISK